ncbi:MAG TPA: hypothetical protein VIO13_09450 [Candidatus Dormibacteraeota bacterium]|jgi:hypothetical protein
MEGNILILDLVTDGVVGGCGGPSADGACPRVAIGGIIPCAGYALVPAGARDARPYTVSSQMTLCPRTVAEALAVASDSALIAA